MASVDVPVPSRSRPLGVETSPFRHIDLPLIGSVIGLAVYGLFMVYSATHRSQSALNLDPGEYLKRQGVFLVIGLVAMIVVALVDYRLAKVYAPFVYLGCLFFLLLVQTPLGRVTQGAQRGIYIGQFQFSPAQFTRIGLILLLAAVLSEVRGELWLRDVMRATILALIPMFLVFIQPDIGTTIILAGILAAILIVSAARWKHLLVVALSAMLAIFGAFSLGVVKEYQVARLTGFLDPSADPQRAGYNKQQAEIAIGAGGLFGKGYLKGSQTNLDFVPEQHTDFIFTVVGEERGFLGALAMLALFGVFLWRAFRVALLAKEPFGTLVAAGIVGMIAIQVFVNVGMTVGIMPITGIPLPFVSYGGSALIADCIGVGLLLSIHARRFG